MILKEKERTVIQDLQTQEKSCIEKYGKYAQQARDPELKSLFQTLQKKEQEHYDSLSQVLSVTSIIAPSPVSIISAQNISAELPVLPRYSRLE